MWKEFKAFIAKGNVMDMAVGVIIGGAFGKIVSSLVSDIFTPILSLITGSANFSDLKIILKAAQTLEDGTEIPAATLNYGMFIQNVIDFFVIALCVFFLVKIVNTIRTKAEELARKAEHKEPEEKEPEKEPEPTKEELLLTEIRDLLKENAQK